MLCVSNTSATVKVARPQPLRHKRGPVSSIPVEDRSPEAEAIRRKLEFQANEIAKDLEASLNPNGQRETGFALLLFTFGDTPTPTVWISNSERESMIKAVEEWLRHAKGRH